MEGLNLTRLQVGTRVCMFVFLWNILSDPLVEMHSK